jgi:hypothetical protein
MTPDSARQVINRCLTNAPDDARLVQIVGGHFHLHTVTDRKPDEAFAHLARNGSQHLMFVIQFDTKHGSRQHGLYTTFDFYMLFHENSRKNRATPLTNVALEKISKSSIAVTTATATTTAEITTGSTIAAAAAAGAFAAGTFFFGAGNIDGQCAIVK